MKKFVYILLFIPFLCQGQYEVRPDVKPMVLPEFRVIYEPLVTPTPPTPPIPYNPGHFYVDSVSGNDANSGTHPDTAWQTIAKINGETFDPDDTISLNRGDEWNVSLRPPSSGTYGSPIVFDAYGTGDKPLINLRDSIWGWETSGNWTQDGDSWYMTGVSNDPLRVWIDTIEVMLAQTAAGVDTLERFYWTTAGDDSLYIFGAMNPAGWTSIYNVQPGNSINISSNSQDYITIDNLDLRGSRNTLGVSGGVSNWTIQNCNLARYAGIYGIWADGSAASLDSFVVANNSIDFFDEKMHAWEHDNDPDGIAIRYDADQWEIYDNTFKNCRHSAIGLDVWDSTYNITNIKIYDNFMTAPDIDYGRGFHYNLHIFKGVGNEFYNNYIYDCVVTNQLSGPNLRFYNNIIDGNRGAPYRVTGVGLSFDTYAGGVHDVEVVNNIVMNCAEWGFRMRHDNWDSNYNNVIKNNIFANNDTGTYYQMWIDDDTRIFADTFQNNLFYSSATTDVIYYRGAAMTVTEFEAGVTNNDSASENVYGDPNFVAALNYHLEQISPGDEMGLAVSWLTTDYIGDIWSDPPNVGVYDSIVPDITAPYYVSGEIGTFDDSIVIIIMSEYLDQDSVPPGSAINLTQNGSAVGSNTISINVDTLKIALDSALTSGTTLLIDLTQDYPYLQDTAENAAANWVDSIVVNNISANDSTYTDDFEGRNIAALGGQGDWIAAYNVINVVDFSGDQVAAPGTDADWAVVYYNAAISDDQYSEMVIDDDVGGAWVGVGVRLTGTDAALDGYLYTTDLSTTSRIQRIDNGVRSTLFSGNAFTEDDVMRIEVVDDTIYAYKNGALDVSINSTGKVQDATYSTGKPGLYSFEDTPGTYMDDWEGGNAPKAESIPVLVFIFLILMLYKNQDKFKYRLCQKRE